jgi:TRAP-type mannitol/chloroaromatic compound transport system substrate-binding protein
LERAREKWKPAFPETCGVATPWVRGMENSMTVFGGVKAAVAAMIAFSAISSATAADDKITLRLADSLPVGHVIHQVITKPFIEAVEKRTNGAV